jgi:hypothetical protein
MNERNSWVQREAKQFVFERVEGRARKDEEIYVRCLKR